MTDAELDRIVERAVERSSLSELVAVRAIARRAALAAAKIERERCARIAREAFSLNGEVTLLGDEIARRIMEDDNG